MKIAAALAWFDEPADFLSRCVESLAGFADVLVTADGPWQGFPSAEASSPPEQAQAIRNAWPRREAFAELSMSQPWKSQVEKRDTLMRLASQNSDWILVIDGDEWLDHEPGDLELIETRHLLATTDLDVASIHFRNVNGSNQAPSRIRRLYRSPVTVERTHHGYRTKDGRWLHGDPTRATLEPTLDLPLSMLHAQTDRGEARNQAATEYRQWRRRTQSERWTT